MEAMGKRGRMDTMGMQLTRNERNRPVRWGVPGLVVGLALLAGCSGPVGGGAVVTGVGEDDFLRLRTGPGLGFRPILGLPDGAEVTRRDCVSELGQLWCRVSLRDAPGISGYVAADYLTER
jgi:hypothetical protein